MEILVHSFYVLSCLGLLGWGTLKCQSIGFLCHVDRIHRMGRSKDSGGFVLFVKLARLGRDGDFSSLVLCAQLPRIAGMGRV